MTTCQNCGAPDQTLAFCSNCGQPTDSGRGDQPTIAPPSRPVPTPPPPVAPPAPPAPPAEAPRPPAPGYAVPPPQAPPAVGHPAVAPPGAVPPPQGYPRGHAGPPAPARPVVNPFPGWPISDYARDVAAAFFLFAALGMPWTLDGHSWDTSKWWVVLGVLLSVLSLALPYVHRAQVIPNWSSLHSKLAKLGANLPLLVGALAAVINELINATDGRAGGLGIGIGMALAGLALAIQPRRSEEAGSSDDALWNLLTYGAGVAAVAVGSLLFAFGVVAARSFLFDDLLAFFALLLVSPVMLLVMVGWPLLGLLTGSAAWRRVFTTVTFTVPVIALLALADDGTALFAWAKGDKIWHEGFSLLWPGTMLIGAAAGLSVTRSLTRRPKEQVEPVAEWQKTAGSALMLTAAFSAISLVALVIGLVDDSNRLVAPIILMLLVLAIAGAAGFAITLVGKASQYRLVLLGTLSGIVLVGIIAMVVANETDTEISNLGAGPSLPVSAWLVAAWVVLPCLAAFALTVPRDVRVAYGPLIPPQQFSGSPVPPAPYGQPGAPYGQPGPPSGGHQPPPPLR